MTAAIARGAPVRLIFSFPPVQDGPRHRTVFLAFISPDIEHTRHAAPHPQTAEPNFSRSKRGHERVVNRNVSMLARSIGYVSSHSVANEIVPTLVFDGDCGFCTSAVNWLQNALASPPSVVPYQRADLDSLGLTTDEAAARVWFVTMAHGRGHQYGGHLAVAAILRAQPDLASRFLGNLLRTFPFSPIAAVGYSLVARFRHQLPGGTPACRMTAE